MPRSKTNKVRPKVSAELVERAANTVLQDGISIRQAAKDFEVSKSTLFRHLKKHVESGSEQFKYEANNAVKKVFSEQQELELVGYLKEAANMHYGLSISEVRQLAFNYAKANNVKYPTSWNEKGKAGSHWLCDFVKKHDISLRKPQQTSLARATAFNRHNVSLFFGKLQELMLRYNFLAGNIFNLDETGILTVHVPGKIIAPQGVKQVGAVTSGERGVNVTIISAVNCIGNAVPPMFVFPCVHFKDFMLKGAPPGSVGTAHKSGWSTSEIFLKYLNQFIQAVKPNIENKVLLILDNHESHVSVEAITLAKTNGIVMLTFPPHTSHRLQPLDRTVFGPLKRYYNSACQEWLCSNPGKQITIYDVAECIGKAYPRAMTPANIEAGFRVSGIYLLDSNIFGDHEFLPSFVTDRSLLENDNFYQNDNLMQNDIAGPSTAAPQTPRQNNDSPTHVTPQEIRPYPKAQPRKFTIGGRRRGKCRILTDTPEKTELELLALARHNKSKVKQVKRNIGNTSKDNNRNKKNKATVKIHKNKKYLESSTSEDDINMSDSDSLEDIEIETEKVNDEIGLLNNPLDIADFILVKLAGKNPCATMQPK